jgi:4-hydroxy-2-oxoheptanedioate aldolase
MPSPFLTEIISRSGFDFQILDCEHGSYDYDSLYKDILACELHKCSPIIRVKGLDKVEVQRCLDLGADGIVFPQLSSYGDFEKAADLMKYAPRGTRGFNPFVRSAGFGAESKPEKTDPCCITIIETLQAVRELENICKLGGIDMIYIGSYDLSAQLNVIGKMDAPELVAVVDGILQVCKQYQKPVSIMVHNQEQLKHFQNKGVNVFVHSVDSVKISTCFTALLSKK